MGGWGTELRPPTTTTPLTNGYGAGSVSTKSTTTGEEENDMSKTLTPEGHTITIEQLGAAGEVTRTFTRYAAGAADLTATLARIGAAYRMPSTRVTVDGQVQP